MSSGSVPEGVMFTAEEGTLAMIRVRGNGVRNLADGFNRWILNVSKSEKIQCILVDLSECAYIDSTFMGLLVKCACLTPAKKRLIANASPSNQELLNGIGVMKGWEYVEQPVQCDNWESLCDALSGKLNERLVLEVHEGLIQWDERNKKFIPFVELCKEELKAREGQAEAEEEEEEEE